MNSQDELLQEELKELEQGTYDAQGTYGTLIPSALGFHLSLSNLAEQLGRVAEKVNDLGVEGSPSPDALRPLRTELRALGGLVLKIILETKSNE